MDYSKVKEEIEDLFKWMRNASGEGETNTLECLVANDDVYEVVGEFHLTNDEIIRVKNNCIATVRMGKYCGSTIIDINNDTVTINCAGLTGNQLLAFIPFSSICWIKSYGNGVDWNSVMNNETNKSE